MTEIWSLSKSHGLNKIFSGGANRIYFFDWQLWLDWILWHWEKLDGSSLYAFKKSKTICVKRKLVEGWIITPRETSKQFYHQLPLNLMVVVGNYGAGSDGSSCFISSSGEEGSNDRRETTPSFPHSFFPSLLPSSSSNHYYLSFISWWQHQHFILTCHCYVPILKDNLWTLRLIIK